jgi:hypothetical protein
VGVPGVAVHYAGGGNWLDDGARAVGDGQGGGLGQYVSVKIRKVNARDQRSRMRCGAEESIIASVASQTRISEFQSGILRNAHLGSSVGDTVEGQLSGSWADGRVGGVDLGGVDNSAVVVGRGSGCESCEGDDGVLHLDGGDWYYLL